MLAAPALSLAAAPSPDAQLWTEADFIGSIARDTTLTGLLLGRFGASVPNPTLTAVGLEVGRKVGRWTFVAGYRHQVVTHFSGTSEVQGLALVMATYTDVFGRSTVDVRARIDDTLPSTGNSWRFRIRPEYQWATPGAKPISYVFINDEAFYQSGEWFRNRAQAGMNLILDRRTALLLYYQWQNDERSHPARINALGLTLKVNCE